MKRITACLNKDEMITDSKYGDILWSDWIDNEVDRMNKVTPGYAYRRESFDSISIWGKSQLIESEIERPLHCKEL